jgi:hypothetical protein
MRYDKMVHGLWEVARDLNTLVTVNTDSIASRKEHVIWRCLCVFVK